MVIFTIVAVTIIVIWFALTIMLWASFKAEEKEVHPIYRPRHPDA